MSETMPVSEIVVARGLLEEALADSIRGSRRHTRLTQALARLDEPVRIAIAGRIKAGKSTLLNALLGEELAPTDAGECTRIVTWYLASKAPSITVVTRDGRRLPQPIRRAEGRLLLDTGGVSADDIERIEVGWPSPVLADMTLVDTPGLASLSEEVSQRSTAALLPEDATSPVDAVLYLLRHLHSIDAGFLGDLSADERLGIGPATTLGVLSRADEVGGGRIDSLISAERVAQRYRTDAAVRALCLDVLPVAGLMAECGRTLRQGEFDALTELAQLDRQTREDLLVAADRFASASPPGLRLATPELRRRLLDRLGVFGIRLATVLIRDGFGTATTLSDELVRRSGLDELVALVTGQFSARAEGLKSRSALIALRTELERERREAETDSLGSGAGTESDADLEHRVHRALLGNHHPDEMMLLATLRSDPPGGLSPDDAPEAERIIGGSGLTARERLGLDASAGTEEVRDAVFDQTGKWRRLGNDPARDQAFRDTAQTVIRSLEGLLVGLPAATPSRPVPAMPADRTAG